MTNEELLNMFAGQAMQAMLQNSNNSSTEHERICKSAWRVARMMLNAKNDDQKQFDKVNVSTGEVKEVDWEVLK